MPMPKSLQHLFFDAILDPNISLDKHISSKHLEARLAIYRNNVRGNLVNALRVTFPGVWKLLGEECANSVAYAFIINKKNFPSSGCLDDWGEHFPEFLASLPELSELTYLEDYAIYEWNKQLIYNATGGKTLLETTALSAISEEDFARLRVYFTPCVSFFKSSSPIDQIEEMLNEANNEGIKLETRNSYCIIHRFNDQILSYWIEEGLFAFLYMLHQGKTFEQASTKAVDRFPNFDIVQAIFFMLSKRLLSHYMLVETD